MEMTSLLPMGPAAASPSASPSATASNAPAGTAGEAADGQDGASPFAALLAQASPEGSAADADRPGGRRGRVGRGTADAGLGLAAEDDPAPRWRGLEIDPDRLGERLSERQRVLRGDAPEAEIGTHPIDRAVQREDLTLSPEMARLLDALEIAPRLARAEGAAPEAEGRTEVAETLTAAEAGQTIDGELPAWMNPTLSPETASATASGGTAGRSGLDRPPAASALDLRSDRAESRPEARGEPRAGGKAARADRGATPGHLGLGLASGNAPGTAGRAGKAAGEDPSAPLQAGAAVSSLGATPAAPTAIPEGVRPALTSSGAAAAAPVPGAADASRAGVLGASAPGPANAPGGTAPSGGEAALPFQAQLSAALESPAFVPALGVQLRTLVSEGIARAELQLHPADLGPIAVSISMDGNQAQVQLTVDNAATRETLQQALPQLSEALRDAGLSLGGGTVSQQPSSSGGQDPSAGRGSSVAGRNGAGRGDAEGDGATPPLPGVASRPRGLLDLYA
jgi:flagellar hook-length control protein FliK